VLKVNYLQQATQTRIAKSASPQTWKASQGETTITSNPNDD
jgi:hypothetical protein